MNCLFKVRKESGVSKAIDFKTLLYCSLLSEVVPLYSEEDDIKYGVFGRPYADLFEMFHEWDSVDESKNEVLIALNLLIEDGFIFLDDEDNIYLGEFRGKKFFTFETENSLFEKSLEVLEKFLTGYKKSKSAKDKSRAKFIQGFVDKILSNGIENIKANEFTELHGYLYEIYTGGEIYIIRNKVEHFQTNNMLKAYDRFTVFSILVEGVLHYDTYRTKGVPTITNVAMIKDEVFKSLTKGSGSKDHMRDVTEVTGGDF